MMQSLLINLHNLFVAASNQHSLRPERFFGQLRKETEHLNQLFCQWAEVPLSGRGQQFREQVIYSFTSILDYEDELHQIREPYASQLSIATLQLRNTLCLHFNDILDTCSDQPVPVEDPIYCIPRSRIIELIPNHDEHRLLPLSFWNKVRERFRALR